MSRGFIVFLYISIISAAADPVLTAVRYFGYPEYAIRSVALDPAGNIYIAGSGGSIPLVNAIQPKPGGGNCAPFPSRTFAQCPNVYVAKFDPTGTRLIYSTYLSGDKSDLAAAIAADRDGNAYVAGVTNSPSAFPYRAGPGNAFVKKLSPDGSKLLYARYIGGLTAVNGLALDGSGRAYVAGYSVGTAFPAVHPLPNQPMLKPLYVTHHSGHTWRSLHIGSVTQVNSLAIDPTRADTLYAATTGGFYKSTDGGANWTRLLPTAEWGIAVTVDPREPSVIYFWSGSYQLFRSTDAGATWTAISANFPPSFPSPTVDAFTVDPVDSKVLWAMTYGQHAATVVRSPDRGDHWETVHAFAPEATSFPKKLLIDPHNHSRLYACCVYDAGDRTGGVYRSDDAGRTWVRGAVGLAAYSGVLSPWLDPSTSGVLYAASYYGVQRSTDGGMTWTWVPLPSDLSRVGYQPGGLALDALGTLYLANDMGYMLRSTDHGATWSKLDGPWSPQAAILAIDPRDPSTIYVSSGSFGLAGGPTVEDAFVAKLDTAGGIEWATLLGGSGVDEARGIAVDASDNAYVTGTTSSNDFPLVNPLQAARTNSPNAHTDAFVSKISADGSKLLYSTYLGGPGRDAGNAIAVDARGNAYVGGGSQYGAFPTVGPALSPVVEIAAQSFLAKLDPSGRNLMYSIVLTSSPNYPVSDQVNAVAVDADGSVLAAGITGDGSFPLVRPVQPTMGLGASFIAQLTPAGNAYEFSTYLGELHEEVTTVAPAAKTLWIATTAGLSRIDFQTAATDPGVPSVRSLSNAASYKPGDLIAPGEIVTVMGAQLAPAPRGATSGSPLPRSIDGVSVSIGGIDAPLFYVSPSQINFQAPIELAVGPTTLFVRRGAQQSMVRAIQVIPEMPGLFAAGPDPRGGALVVHASDFSLVTHEHPARRGENLAAFCTGLGATEPAAVTGEPARSPATLKSYVSAYLGSAALMQVSYAGLAPGWTGLYQVNFRINDNAQIGKQYLHMGVGQGTMNQGTLWIADRLP